MAYSVWSLTPKNWNKTKKKKIFKIKFSNWIFFFFFLLSKLLHHVEGVVFSMVLKVGGIGLQKKNFNNFFFFKKKKIFIHKNWLLFIHFTFSSFIIMCNNNCLQLYKLPYRIESRTTEFACKLSRKVYTDVYQSFTTLTAYCLVGQQIVRLDWYLHLTTVVAQTAYIGRSVNDWCSICEVCTIW